MASTRRAKPPWDDGRGLAEPRSDPIAELLGRVARRDRAAFDALYTRTAPKLFGVALRILRERAEAEEALQEIYVKIWRSADRYSREAGAGATWIVAIARNHSIDRLRARRSSESADAAQAAETEAIGLAEAPKTPEELAIQHSERDRLEQALALLDPAHAALIRGAYLEGKSYHELAEEAGAPINTVRTWLRRSLQKLRKHMDR